MRATQAVIALLFAATLPAMADAYIGPGAGLSAIGTILALIGGIVLGIVGFVWYPIKKLIAKFRRRKADPADPARPE